MFRPHAAILSAAAAFVLAGLGSAKPAAAIPVFAHRYGLSCQACHTVVPRLTDFGERFEANGFRLPGMRARGAFPAAVKVELAYGSEAEGGMPKALVDEVEILLGGSIGSRGSYFAEQYVVDGGVPGRPRDAWAAWAVTPRDARLPVAVRAGRFTLDLPVDPETFRETTDHYAIFDQTAGGNPFTFFAPQTGVMAMLGNRGRGLSGSAAALQGHDVHVYVQHASRGATVSAFRYAGTRAVDGARDRFWRQGYGLALGEARLRVDLGYLHGFDTRATADGALRSSGGFAQVRYDLTPRLFGIARYDATHDTGFARAFIAGAGYRLARNARFSVFDTLHRDAETGRARNTLSTQLLIAE